MVYILKRMFLKERKKEKHECDGYVTDIFRPKYLHFIPFINVTRHRHRNKHRLSKE